MARITVEDCLKEENNRFALVQLASKRTKQLLHGSKPVIDDPRANKAVVMALREIASGKVRFMTPEEARIAEERQAQEESVHAQDVFNLPSSIGDDLFKTDLLDDYEESAEDEGPVDKEGDAEEEDAEEEVAVKKEASSDEAPLSDDDDNEEDQEKAKKGGDEGSSQF